MAKENKVEPKYKNLDDVFRKYGNENVNTIDEAHKAIIKFDHKDKIGNIMSDIQLDVTNPAHDAMYDAMKKKLEKGDFNRDSKTHNKEEKLQEVIVEGLKAYFEKADPAIARSIDSSQSITNQYQFLTQRYRMSIGDDRGQHFGDYARHFANDKNATANQLLNQIYQTKGSNSSRAAQQVLGEIKQNYLSRFRQTEMMEYAKKNIEKKGLKHKNTHELALMQHDQLYDIIKGTETDDWGMGKEGPHGYQHHGLKKDKKK